MTATQQRYPELVSFSVSATMCDQSTQAQREAERVKNEQVYKFLATLPDDEARSAWSAGANTKFFRFPEKEINKHRNTAPQV